MAKKKTKPTPATEAVKAERKIPLQDPERLTVRIVDSKTKVDKARVEALVEAGWQYLDPDDLAVRAADIGFKVMDSHIVCGDHGEEVILKILTVDLEAFEEAEEERIPAEEQENRGLRPAERSLEKSEIAAQEVASTEKSKPTRAAQKQAEKQAAKNVAEQSSVKAMAVKVPVVKAKPVKVVANKVKAVKVKKVKGAHV